MIRFNCKGELKKTDTFLRKMVHLDLDSILDRYGKEGVDALASATPRRTGKTAESWSYEIHGSGSSKTITWTNSNINNGVCIAVIPIEQSFIVKRSRSVSSQSGFTAVD